MADQWSKLTIHFDKEKQEIEVLTAWLNYYSVESTVEGDGYVEAYFKVEQAEDAKDQIERNTNLNLEKLTLEEVENKNWNEVWESNFDPITVGNISIRAEFHEPIESEYEILIKPKMAFGTGHHQTTYMMLEQMSKMDFDNKFVLDYGCGTGILAVFALMRNASHLVAIDVQEEAIENTLEHIDLNNIERREITVFQEDIEQIKSYKYDIILANINRHVLLAKTKIIRKSLHPEGLLIASGILKSDERKILAAYIAEKFEVVDKVYKDDWCLFVLKKLA